METRIGMTVTLVNGSMVYAQGQVYDSLETGTYDLKTWGEKQWQEQYRCNDADTFLLDGKVYCTGFRRI